MSLRVRIGRDLRTATVAVVAASVVAGPTAVAASYVANADKVDNKHAVGAGATVQTRKGKLVATNARTGLLPNNIIGTAPDSDLLDGRDSAELLPRQVSAEFAHPDDDVLGLLTNTTDDIAQVSIAVPGPGRVQVDATTVVLAKPGPGDDAFVELSVSASPHAHNAPQATTSVWAVRQGVDDGFYYETIPTSATFDVAAAGTYTYFVVGDGSAEPSEPASAKGPFHYTTQVTAQYFPVP